MAGAASRTGVRKILIHINNTNPILDEDSPERTSSSAAESKSRMGRHGDRHCEPIGAPGAARSSRRSCADRERRITSTTRYNVLAERRRREPRADPRLGRQPLLLPDQHSDQGRGDPVELSRPRGAPQAGCSAFWTMTAMARIPAASNRGCGWRKRSGCRGDAVEDLRRGAAGRAFRGRRLRELRPPRAVAGGRVLLAHGAVRAGDPQAAPRRLAEPLPLDRPGGSASISKAA